MNPRVFISYSHDSDDYKDWVRSLADRLIGGGVDVTIDQYDLALGQMIPHFMEKGISESDFVILLITPTFAQKARERTGGVGFEVDLASGEIVVSRSRRKFIPVLVKLEWNEVPPLLKGAKGVRITNLFSYDKEYKELYEALTGQSLRKPSLGTVKSVAPAKDAADPFDVVKLGSLKNLPHFCYFTVRFELKNLKGMSVAELYSAIQRHTYIEDIHGYLRAEPYILTPNCKKSNQPEIIYESADYAANYTNVMDYDKLIIAQGILEYSFVGFKTDKPFYFSSEIAQEALLRFFPIIEKVLDESGAIPDLGVALKVKSSTNAIFQTSGRPLPVKGQMWENYVHPTGTTIGNLELHSFKPDDARRVFNRLLEGFVSEKKDSTMPFLQVDEKVFSNVYREHTEKTP